MQTQRQTSAAAHRHCAAPLIRHLRASHTASPAVIHPFFFLLLISHKHGVSVYFSSEYCRRGLTKRSQKQTADDLFPITSSSLPPHSVPRSHCTFSQASLLFLSLSSSSSVPPPPPDCLRHPPLLVSPALLPFFPASLWLLASSSTCLSFHPTHLLLHLTALPLPFPFIHSLPPSSTLCYSACLPACRYLPIKDCLRPPLC